MGNKKDKARAMLLQVMGKEFVAERDASTNDFNRDLRELAEEVTFGNVWARPGLEPRIRSMLCIAMLAASAKPNQLRQHVHGALNNGCTVEELQELALQVAAYCGFPAAGELTHIVEKVLGERGVPYRETGSL